MKLRGLLAMVLALTISVLLPMTLCAQSTTQGAIRGTVLDPSGAAISNAAVTLHNDDTGQSLTNTTNATGGYNFNLVQPGNYTISASAPSYQTSRATVIVTVGQISTSILKLPVSAANQTVTVTAEGNILQTVDPNVSTTMSSEQIHLVPNGGGDLTYIAQTAPGTVMNSQGGFGNFSANGLPANTNNFTVNSMPENDPFLNLNNSGSTNILLGRNDVSEATIVTNGYSGEYSMAGANVNYVSRSGTNSWHGNATWWWNGRYVNANDYFNGQSSPPTPKPFVNDNQWAASIGGPIRKDKTFFFVNTEGLYLIVPVENSVNMPTPAFQSATLANIAAVQPAELTMYQTMFNLYNNAPGASTAVPVTGAGTNLGCSADFVGTLGFGVTTPCAQTFHNSVSTNTHEWLVTARADQYFGNNDRAFLHFRMDRGLQASVTDPLTPVFNVTSNQPQYEAQAQWVHTFSPNTINTFNLNGSYYSAVFNFANQAAAVALQPVEVAFAGGTFFNLANNYQVPFAFPQGRNVTEYGAVDDFSRVWGNHSFKFGGNFARYDVTTHGPGQGSLPGATNETLTDFYNGVATTYQQSFPVRPTQPLNLYNMGLYAQDTWRVRSNLNLTLTLRADRASNPSCVTNCFSRLAGNFLGVDHSITTPYNQTVLANQGNALPGSYHAWTLEPRFGFNYNVAGTVVFSGGFGIFGTTLPAGYTDSLINNLPNDPSFAIPGVPYGPGITGNGQSVASAAATALRTGFASGADYAALNSAVTGLTGVPFSVPNFFNAAGDIHTPRFQEWDFQMQKGFGNNMSVTLKYVGNHGIWEQINNGGQNSYCGPTAAVTAAPGTPGCLTALAAAGYTGTTFAGLPALPIDPRFQGVQEMSAGYNSNYNGFTASFMRRFSSLQFQLNYTWSHALDDVSNSGQNITPFNLRTNTSITAPQNPFNVYQNMYGNADYDIRHYFSANYVYTTPKSMFTGFVGRLLGDWTIAGTIFAHSGLPFTVTDGAIGGTLGSYGYGGTGLAFADQTGGFGSGISCGSGYANPNNGTCPAMTSNFGTPSTGFGMQRRNQVYGPKFFDTDLSISKAFPIPHWEKGTLSIGASAFNLFNHPNFDQPVGDIANPLFGSIILPSNPPTSIYGSFLGADASPRLLQSEIKLVF